MSRKTVLAVLLAAGVLGALTGRAADDDVAHFHHLTSFFVMAPDKLLVEIVQKKSIPDDIWR